MCLGYGTYQCDGLYNTDFGFCVLYACMFSLITCVYVYI